jgi:hypothetical protein
MMMLKLPGHSSQSGERGRFTGEKSSMPGVVSAGHPIAKHFSRISGVTTEVSWQTTIIRGRVWRDMKPELKERRRIARNSAHEGMKTFFQRNGVEFEEEKHSHFSYTARDCCLLPAKQADAA